MISQYHRYIAVRDIISSAAAVMSQYHTCDVAISPAAAVMSQYHTCDFAISPAAACVRMYLNIGDLGLGQSHGVFILGDHGPLDLPVCMHGETEYTDGPYTAPPGNHAW